MLTYYEIPKNVHYVQFIKEIESWNKVNSIDFNVPTVAVIEDSKATHYPRFVVIYKGLMQLQGGSGSCYNPVKPTFIHNQNPMDNSVMPSHMSKWTAYSYSSLLKLVIACKYQLLEKLGYIKAQEEIKEEQSKRSIFDIFKRKE